MSSSEVGMTQGAGKWVLLNGRRSYFIDISKCFPDLPSSGVLAKLLALPPPLQNVVGLWA